MGYSFELTKLPLWIGNLGHHLTAEGHLLFYNEGSGDPPIGSVFDLLLDEADWTATEDAPVAAARVRLVAEPMQRVGVRG